VSSRKTSNNSEEAPPQSSPIKKVGMRVKAVGKGVRNLSRTPKKPSRSNISAGSALEHFAISPLWRVYAAFAAFVGFFGHFSSLVGLFNDDTKWRMWHETDSHFVYQQITFVTSTIYCYNYSNLVWNVSNE